MVYFKSSKIIIALYIFISVVLLFYSYTQVDLGLTLTEASIWQTIQKYFQHIGSFQRQLSTFLYIVILCLLFGLYVATLWLVQRNRLTRKDIWKVICSVSLILVFSYPAFSYDFFNYMFTARTVLVYQKNPYVVAPLDFIGVEPWLGFMHWTHATSAYPPLWIILTIPPYLLGFGYFLLILYNTKFLIAGGYILTAVLIERALQLEDKKNALLGLTYFALSPLVIIESLVSAHNDIAMMVFAIGSYYFYLKKQRTVSILMLVLSVAVKSVTILWLPLIFLGWKKAYMLVFSVISFVAVLTQREVQAWYFLLILPVVATQPSSRRVLILCGGISLGLLLRYAPFLYYGDWNDPVPLLKQIVLFVPVAITLLFLFFDLYTKRKVSSQRL